MSFDSVSRRNTNSKDGHNLPQTGHETTFILMLSSKRHKFDLFLKKKLLLQNLQTFEFNNHKQPLKSVTDY